MNEELVIEFLEELRKLSLNIENLVGELHGINSELFEIKTILNARLR